VAYVASEDRKRQLIDATVRVVAQHGVSKASTRQIAKEAGTNLATLHYVFGTKEELFASVMLEQLDFSEGMNFAAVAPPKSGLRRAIRVMLEGFRAAVVDRPAVALAQYEMLFWALRSAESNHLAKHVYTLYLDTMAANFAEAATTRERTLDTRALARYVFMVVDGFYLQQLTVGECITDAEMPAVVESLLDLVKALPRVEPAVAD
jgi:AcrR family transcriptional regulator